MATKTLLNSIKTIVKKATMKKVKKTAAKAAPAKKAKPAPAKKAKPAPAKKAKPAPAKKAKPQKAAPAKKVAKPVAKKAPAPVKKNAPAVKPVKKPEPPKKAAPAKPIPPTPKHEKTVSAKKMEEKVTRNPVSQSKPLKAEVKTARPVTGASSAPKIAPLKVEIKPVHLEEPKVTPRPVGEDLFSAEELDMFKELLEAERTKLLAKAKRLVEEGNIQIDKNEMMDEVDQASAMVEQNLTFRLLDRDRKLLDEIEHALAKIETGDYGYCEGTGDPIPKRRLELRPWCRHSVKYKEKLERMKKSGRGVVDEDEV